MKVFFLKKSVLLGILVVIMGGVVLGVLLPDQTLRAASFIVNVNSLTDDNNPGDGVCADTVGDCSLKAALMEANANPDMDTIAFSGPMTITFPPTPGFDLSITSPVIVDASTAGTCPTGQGVVIDANGKTRAFYVGSGGSGSTIKGFIIKNYSSYGIGAEGTSGSTTTFSCNVIGLDGTTAAGAGQGIYFGGGASDIMVGGDDPEDRNTIAGNQMSAFTEGIGFNNNETFTSSNITIKNNYFGVDTGGTIAIPNGTGEGQGVDLYLGEYNNVTISNNLFAGAGIVSDSTSFGDGLVIQSNTFDLQPDGETFINAASGEEKHIDIYGFQNILIGGVTPDLGNISAGTGSSSAVRIRESSDIEMYNNKFGILSDGITPAITNGGYGNVLFTLAGVDNATIGGSPSLANYFVGGGRGTVVINGFDAPNSNILFAGNYVNVGSDNSPLSEGVVGVAMIGSGSGNIIGGTTEDERNKIHGSTAAVNGLGAVEGGYLLEGNDLWGGDWGALVFDTVLAPITSYLPMVRNNFLRASVSIEIAKDSNGDTLPETDLGKNINDAGDSDEGSNDKLNHPVLISGGVNTVRYMLDVPVSSNPYRVEFFVKDETHVSGPLYEYLDYDTQTISTPGIHIFSKTFSSVDLSHDITATVTSCADVGCTTYKATSEFGNSITDSTGGIDLGTASGSQTGLEEGGAYHIVTDSYLGSCINSDTNAVSDQDGGILYAGTGPCSDDRDGVSFDKETYLADDTIEARITATDDGFLNVWVDLNQDGDFSDSDEWFFVNEPVVSGLNTLTLPHTPSGAGSYNIRFRYTTYEHDDMLPTGEALDGEVEDYVLVVEEPEEESTPPPVGTVGGGGGTGMAYTCRDPKASNYRSTGMNDSSLCVYSTYEYNVKVKSPSSSRSDIPNLSPESEAYYSNLFANIVCPAFTQYARKGDKGEHVKLIQAFLNTFIGTKLPITGYFGSQTVSAVKTFQTLFAKDILTPWYPPKGLPATGYWYKTTRMKANQLLGCQETPVILEDSGKVWDVQAGGESQ